MTKKQARVMTRSLIQKTKAQMQEDLEKVLSSGCIEPADYEDNYRLPKAIMTALCLRMAEQWRPLADDRMKKEITNIGCFI